MAERRPRSAEDDRVAVPGDQVPVLVLVLGLGGRDDERAGTAIAFVDGDQPLGGREHISDIDGPEDLELVPARHRLPADPGHPEERVLPVRVEIAFRDNRAAGGMEEKRRYGTCPGAAFAGQSARSPPVAATYSRTWRNDTGSLVYLAVTVPTSVRAASVMLGPVRVMSPSCRRGTALTITGVLMR
jgi:hypothetical protein